EWAVCNALGGKIPVGAVIEAGIRVIRHDVGRVGGDGNRRWQRGLLPAGCRLAAEGDRAEQRSVRGPEIADVRSRVLRALVEPDGGDVAVDIGTEPRPDLNRIG